MKLTRNISLLTLGLLILGLYSAAFTVNQTQQALVLQFGEPKRIIQSPGLQFKLPFIQDAIYYESRVLSLICLLYTSPSPRDRTRSRMPSSA